MMIPLFCHLAAPQACISMWTQLQQLSASNQVLKLHQPATFIIEDVAEMWVRSCYETLFEKILVLYNQNKSKIGVLVTGNPGIGKSFFLVYLLWRFTQLGKIVIFESAEEKKVYVFKPGKEPVLILGSPVELEELGNKGSVFLHNPMANHEPLFVNAFTVLASSPNPNNYKGFCKRRGCRRFCMPVWSEDEVMSCNSSLQSWNLKREEIEKGFSVFGGIPRFLLDYDTYYQDLRTAILESKEKELIDKAAEASTFKDYSHKLLHFDVSAEFAVVSMSFASDFVFKELIKLWEKKDALALEYFVMETSNAAMLAGARGKAFEVLAHRYLEKVNTHSTNCLEVLAYAIHRKDSNHGWFAGWAFSHQGPVNWCHFNTCTTTNDMFNVWEE